MDSKASHQQQPASSSRDTAREAAQVLDAARLARIEAEQAQSDVEAMLWEVQHVRLGHQRMVFSVAGWDDETPRGSMQ